MRKRVTTSLLLKWQTGLPLVGLLLLLAGCTHSVYYGWEAGSNHGNLGETVTRLYLDRQGDFYPDAAALLPVDRQRLEEHGSALQFYYYLEKKAKWQQRQAAERQELSDYYGAPLPAPSTGRAAYRAAWCQLQDSMQTRFVRRFAQHLRTIQAEALVVLVHGFNNDVGSTRWFSAVQRQIRTGSYLRGKKVHYLELYWDGRAATGVGLLPIWKSAQGTMYPAGLTLRRVLAGIAPNTPVYLMGHSTGAPLICVALWNSTSALSHSSTFETHPGEKYLGQLSQRRYATPRLTQVRVALVSPAMPSRHFKDFANRTDQTGQQFRQTFPDGYQRFVIGHNRHDIATGKGPLPTGFGGSTRLGVKKDEYCGDGTPTSKYGVVPLLRQAGSTAQTYLIDFTQAMAKLQKHRSAHGVLQLMDDEPTFKCLLDGWLTAAPPACADTCP